MAIGYLFLGFIARIVMGLDDALANIPLLSSIAHTKKGRLSFSAGILLAIGIAIGLAWFFSATLKQLPFFKEVLALILFGLAFAIWYDIGIFAPRKKVELEAEKVKRRTEDMYTLFGVGFVSGLATLLDDLVVYTALFTAGFAADVFASIGILLASIVEIYIVIHSAKFLSRLPYKDNISAGGLLVVGILLLIGII